MQAPISTLKPLPYHRRIVEYLKADEPGLWEWFSSGRSRAELADAARLEILKSTYRLERERHGALYALCDEAGAGLGCAAPFTLYQSQQPAGLNAVLHYLPGEAHLVLVGPLAEALTPPELRAVLAHELAHFLLWEGHGGEFLVADRILGAMARDPRAEPSHRRSARLWDQYTEVYADRAALHVAQDPLAAIAALVKIETGTREVSAESYLRQANEIFARETARSGELEHPETFIRARALDLWSRSGEACADEIARMLEGPPTLATLDLPAQKRLTALTRRLLERLLAPAWFRTDAVMGHARLFFPDLAPARPAEDALLDELRFSDPELRDYLCFVLLDFAAADPQLEDAPLAAAFVLAERIALGDALQELAGRELKLRKKQIEKLRKEAAQVVAAADVAQPDTPEGA